MLNEMRVDFQKPMFVGNDPNDFDRGLGFLFWLLACLCIITFSPIWVPIYLVGFAARKLKLISDK